MSPEQANFLGLLAGTLTTISFVPQVWHTWKTRSARDLSLGMLLIFTLGITLWLIYGLWMQAPPLIASNVVTLVLASTLLGFKLRFKN